jgi:hypothetical protein
MHSTKEKRFVTLMLQSDAIEIVAQCDGFFLLLVDTSVVLELQRGGPRIFRTLDAAAKWLRGHGVIRASLRMKHMQISQH